MSKPYTPCIETVDNSPAGWERIKFLRNKWRKKGVSLRLRGRHSDRQSLLPILRETRPGRDIHWLKYSLRSEVPVSLAERIAIYRTKKR